MAAFLLTVFILLCVSLIASGFKDRGKVYQYPFLMAVAFTTFILPQALSLVIASNIPKSALCRTLIMCCLCLGASWVGYNISIPAKWLRFSKNDNSQPSEQILFLYLFLGGAFSLLTARQLDGQVTGISTGIVTIFIFFYRTFTEIAYPAYLIKLFKKTSWRNFLLTIAASASIFYFAFFVGRRTSTGFFFIAIATAYFFIKKRYLPRWIIICSIIFGCLFIFSIKDYRNFLATGNWDYISQANPTENVKKLINDEESVLELRSAAVVIDFAAKYNQYEFGSYYWDRLIFYFFPGQWFGTELKQSLQFNSINLNTELSAKYNYLIPTGSTKTGIAEAFLQFDYFGCFIFAIVGIYFKWLWYRTLVLSNFIDRVVYIQLIIAATIGAVVTGHSFFFAKLLTAIIFTFPLRYWTDKKHISSV